MKTELNSFSPKDQIRLFLGMGIGLYILAGVIFILRHFPYLVDVKKAAFFIILFLVLGSLSLIGFGGMLWLLHSSKKRGK